MATKQSANKLQLFFRLIPILGVICIIAGFGLAISQARFDKASYITVGVGVLLFLTLFIRAEVANLKYYLHVVIYSALVLGVCVVAYLFASQHTQKVDLTTQRLYSLSPQTVKYLKALRKDVQITIFAQSQDPFDEVIDLYKGVTDKVKWRVIDARTHPIEARQFGNVVHNDDIYTTSSLKSKRLNLNELRGNYENVLTNAIIEVTREKNVKVYFLGGHGELAYEQQTAPTRAPTREASLAAFRNYLSQRAIATEKLDLGRTGFVPEDATLVVVAGPKSDLLSPEISALQNYLKKNGKLLVLLDVPTQNFSMPLTNLIEMLKGYGIDSPDKLIIDLYSAQLGANPAQPLCNWFNPEHPVTRDLGGRSSRLLLSVTRPVSVAQAPAGTNAVELLKSSDQSWTEDLAKVMANAHIAPPSTSSLKAQSLGVAVSAAGPAPAGANQPPADVKGGMRLVVYGNSELIQDSYLASNRLAVELMLNTVNWLSEQDDLIAVPPKQIKGTPIVIDEAQRRVIFFFVAILIPAGLFFGGLSYSLLRRRR